MFEMFVIIAFFWFIFILVILFQEKKEKSSSKELNDVDHVKNRANYEKYLGE
jgi:hypothetical protein